MHGAGPYAGQTFEDVFDTILGVPSAFMPDAAARFLLSSSPHGGAAYAGRTPQKQLLSNGLNFLRRPVLDKSCRLPTKEKTKQIRQRPVGALVVPGCVRRWIAHGYDWMMHYVTWACETAFKIV